ncbi:hypothetical protein [Emticicia sp. W12TSBA100-4]
MKYVNFLSWYLHSFTENNPLWILSVETFSILALPLQENNDLWVVSSF